MVKRALPIALFIVALVSALALATGVSISPAVTEILLPPGASYTGEITVENTSDESVVVEAVVRGFTSPEGVPVLLDPSIDNYKYSGREVLTITPNKQQIGPGESVVFNYTVTMPEDLDPYGGRYAAAVFKVEPPSASEAQVVVTAQVASLFLLNPGGDAAPHFTFKDFRVWQDVGNPRLIHCDGLITNDGNVHADTEQMYGFMQITDQDGYIVGQMVWHPHTMLPDNSYRHEETWEAPDWLQSGTYYFYMTTIIYRPDGEDPQRYFAVFEKDLQF